MNVDFDHPSSKRLLEPVERVSEVLFGLIMVLTVTCSLSVAEAGRGEVRAMLVGALGCNFAWGLIDGIMYLMGCLAERARNLAMLRSIRKATDPERVRKMVTGALPLAAASALTQSVLEEIRRQVAALPEPPSHPHLSRRDWLGAIGVFVLVFVSTLPVVLPFVFVQNALRAQRLSNLIAVAMLFVTGTWFGRCIGYHARTMGVVMVVLGGVLVGLTIMLGG